MPQPKVSPTDVLTTHHVSVSDGSIEIGLPIIGGVKGIIEKPRQASTIHVAGGRSKYGDFGAGLAQIGQETWIGGRGLLKFNLDPTRFYDSHMAYTMADGKLFPSIQYRFGEGHRDSDNKMPGAWANSIGHDVKFVSLADNWYAQRFTASASYDAANIEIWVKKVGSPSGSLTVALYSDSSGEPGSSLKSDTLSADDADSYISRLEKFSFAAESLTASTDYWVVVYDTSGGSTSSHWEVGITTGGADQAKYSDDDGSTWTNTDDQILFRVTDADVTQRGYFFELRGALYWATSPASGSATKLYINGSRGVVTSATSTVITDTNQSWTADEWIGSWVKIAEGTGAGQAREITDNTDTTITTAAWDTTPDATSLYVVYSTDKWTDISPGSGDQFDSAITGAPWVVDKIVYFPRGNATVMIKGRFNSGGSPPAHEFSDEATAAADILYGFTDTTNEYQLFCGLNDNMRLRRYTPVGFASDLVSPTAIIIGDDNAEIINMHDYNGYLYVFKEDGLYRVDTDKALREDTGLEFFQSRNTGAAVTNRNFFMYFSYAGFALEQLQKNSSIIDMASIGPDRGEGLPPDRTGEISCLGFHPSGLFASIDGGADNYSSIMVRTDPVGWHEVFRSPRAGQRIRNFYFQDCPGTRPRLWIDLGGDIVFQEWPKNTFNPLKDTGVVYQHETSITMSDIDMGAPILPKAIKAFSLVSENLSDAAYVGLDYQTDEDVGEDEWITKSNLTKSPSDTVDLNLGNIRKIRLRLRMYTEDADVPPIIYATVLQGFARTPVKYDWTFRVKLSSLGFTRLGTPEVDPQEARRFLRNAASNGDVLKMRSTIEDMNDKWVIVEPFVSRPLYKTNVTQTEGYEIELTIREY